MCASGTADTPVKLFGEVVCLSTWVATHAVSSLDDRLHSSTQAGACGRPGADGFPHPCSRKAQ